jgi:hypothetical protein
MKRTASAAGLMSLMMALVCFITAAYLFQGAPGASESAIFISQAR